MTQKHPITPPPDLVQEWTNNDDFPLSTGTFDLVSITKDRLRSIATQAARWGADMELEACCADIHTLYGQKQADWLRSMRRPKPKSQAEEALEALEAEDDDRPLRSLKTGERFDIIRAALERLRELEKSND